MNQPCGDPEHVIPEVIGGRLQSRILCNSCNHSFGSSLVSKLKTDTSIQLAVEALKDQLPELYEKFQNKSVLVGKGTNGSIIKASFRKNKVKILPSKYADGSLTLDTTEAVKSLITKLTRYGLPISDVEIWKHKFLQLKEDEPLAIPTGETFIKRMTPHLQPELSLSHIDDRLLVLMAFEFLSLLIGNCIMESSFNPIRQYIGKEVETDKVTINHFFAGSNYDTFHVISVAPVEEAIRVEIRLFRYLAYIVTFYGFDYRGPDSVYFEDLKTPHSMIAPTQLDASNGNYYIY